MDMNNPPLDLAPLLSLGVQHIPNFILDEELKADLRRRAVEVVAARKDGRLSTDSQDALGFGYDWYESLLKHPGIVSIMTSLLGPDVCGSGWRILIKDTHFRGGINVHQDWPYNTGDTKKVSVFVPLTRVNRANGGLHFYEKSHLYGPVSKGAIDPARFPPLQECCPDIDVGDILLCDFLTWHYSMPAINDDERVMIQLNYQPATDPSSKNLVAGKMPHDYLLLSRFDAVKVPSIELNVPEVRNYIAEGNFDRATRWAKGLLTDDADHVGAALALHDIYKSTDEVAAARYLELARAALKRHAEALDERLRANPGQWRALPVKWHSLIEGYQEDVVMPASMGTPAANWGYGARTDVIDCAGAALIRVRVRSVSTKIGFCLVSNDADRIISEQILVTPADGETDVVLSMPAEDPNARVIARNWGEPYTAGQFVVTAVDLLAN